MAATNGTKQQASALALLKRADSRWARDRADDPAPAEYLEHLATFLQPVAPNANATPAVDEHELTMLREQAAAAETNAAARRAELDQARAEIEQLREQVDTQSAPEPADPAKLREQEKLIRKLRADYDEIAADNEKLADQLAAARTQRDGVINHTCSWQWHGADEPIKPCACGRPVPRYELREVG